MWQKAFPLKGKGRNSSRFSEVVECVLIRAASGIFALKLVPLRTVLWRHVALFPHAVHAVVEITAFFGRYLVETFVHLLAYRLAFRSTLPRGHGSPHHRP